jgi:hypothetical protein
VKRSTVTRGVEVREVRCRADLRRFIFLPEKIHRNHTTWVPPLYIEERRYFDPRKNRAFSYCDTILLLARRGDEVVGRVMGIINWRHNALKGEKTARFACLESWEEPEVVSALLSSVEEWARQRGMNKIIGPFGFSDQDPEGFLIEGFEHRATIVTYHNFPWLIPMMEKEGYAKEVDYFVYRIPVPESVPELYDRIAERIQKRGRFRFLEARSKKDVKPWIVPAFRLMNETFSEADIYGFVPLDEQEMERLAGRYLSFLDARFLKGVTRDGELVAFMIGIPDMTEGIQRARGRLLPLGWWKILRAAKKTQQLDLLLGATKEEYRGLGLDVLMGLGMRIEATRAGFQVVDTHHEMESNVKVRSVMEKWGGEVYKRFRVFGKTL